MPAMIVTTTEAGLSLENFLQQRLVAAPGAYLRKLIKDGKIRRSNDMDTLMAAGERILLPDSHRLMVLLAQSEKLALTILCETEQLLILDKPSGLAIHAGQGQGQGQEEDNLTDRVAKLLKRRGEHFMAAPIQRLDRETSGAVLFGKGKKSCSVLGKMMMNTPVGKTYLALVSGQITTDGTLIDDIPAKGKLKTAITSYQVLVTNDNASLLQIDLKTGRQHQIRRQFQQLGHPLFGDRRYGGPCPENLLRLFLHCQQLAFLDPFTDTPLVVTSPLPQDLTAFLDVSGLSLS